MFAGPIKEGDVVRLVQLAPDRGEARVYAEGNLAIVTYAEDYKCTVKTLIETETDHPYYANFVIHRFDMGKYEELIIKKETRAALMYKLAHQ